jgi:hypothetical protein
MMPSSVTSLCSEKRKLVKATKRSRKLRNAYRGLQIYPAQKPAKERRVNTMESSHCHQEVTSSLKIENMTSQSEGIEFALALLDCLTEEEIDQYLAARGLVFERVSGALP